MPLKLITDLPVDSHDDAVDKLRWYAMRWKIEVFHKILKSGCRAEQARLRIAERLVRLLAVFCILSWRVFWLTMLNRTELGLELAGKGAGHGGNRPVRWLLREIVSRCAQTERAERACRVISSWWPVWKRRLLEGE